MDRTLRREIVMEVRRSMAEIMETANERWLSADELCCQFQMFSKSWLKVYGDRLPRTRAEVEDNGVKVSRWAYPRNKIARMISEGKIKNL